MRREHGDAYDAIAEASVDDVLPPEYAIDYMAWQLSGGPNEGNASEYFKLMEERDIVELTEAYAMKRTQMYLLEELKN